MQNRRVCWNCHYQSLATDTIRGRSNHKCPRCGMEAYQYLVNQFDRVFATPYFVHSTRQVMRAGRERKQLLQNGLYKTDMMRRTVDKLDAFIPDRSIHK